MVATLRQDSTAWRFVLRSAIRLLPVAIALTGLALYTFTLAPTVLWGDDAELQRIVVTGEARTIGQSSAASHLLWLVIASWFVRLPGLPGDVAARTNFVSAFWAALTLPFMYAAAAQLWPADGRRSTGMPRTQHTSGLIAGAAAATALALSHTFWLLAVRPNVYTLQTVLIVASLWLVLRWRRPPHHIWQLALAAGLLVLALFNHALVLASLPGLLWLAITLPPRAWRRLIPAALLALGLGALLLVMAIARGAPVMALAQAVLAYRVQLPLLRDALLVPAYLWYQFPLSLPLAVVGVGRLWRTDRAAMLGLGLLYLGNVLLVLTRHHPAMYVRDQFLFLLVSYLPVALLVGLGAATIAAWLRRCRPWRQRLGGGLSVGAALLAPLVLYPSAAWTVGTVASHMVPARQLPGRDPVSFYLLPWKIGYTGAAVYARTALAELPAGALVVADWLPYQALRYVQVIEGQRPDVMLAQINAGGQAQLHLLLAQPPTRPLYLADNSPFPYYEMAEIERCFRVVPAGMLYRLERRQGGRCPPSSSE